MNCRNCGTEIADKALICFRCGTATTEAKFKPAAIRQKRSSLRMVIVAAIVIAVLVLLAFFLLHSGSPSMIGSHVRPERHALASRSAHLNSEPSSHDPYA